MVGRIALLKNRDHAKTALGKDFDLKDFHYQANNEINIIDTHNNNLDLSSLYEGEKKYLQSISLFQWVVVAKCQGFFVYLFTYLFIFLLLFSHIS